MGYLSYPDKCIITRATEDVDEYGSVVATEIYDGVCDFHAGSQSSLKPIAYSDIVYLPQAVMIEENDMISVTTSLGRTREGVVAYVNDLGLDLTGDYITEIGIKQSK